MKFCVNEATTMNADFATDVRAYAAAGFRGIELWLDKVERFLQKESLSAAAALLKEHGLSAAAACAQGNLMLSEGQARKEAFDGFRRRLEICAALEVPVLIAVPDFPAEVKLDDYRRGVEGIREAADLSSQYGVKLAVEVIKGAKFVGSLSTASKIVREANHDYVGLVLDTFHYWAGISKPQDIETMPVEKLFLVHVNDCLDVPREILDDSYRTYLGEGVLPVRDIVSALKRRGYQGWYSFEIFNRAAWQEDPFQVAAKAFRCMKEVLA